MFTHHFGLGKVRRGLSKLAVEVKLALLFEKDKSHPFFRFVTLVDVRTRKRVLVALFRHLVDAHQSFVLLFSKSIRLQVLWCFVRSQRNIPTKSFTFENLLFFLWQL